MLPAATFCKRTRRIIPGLAHGTRARTRASQGKQCVQCRCNIRRTCSILFSKRHGWRHVQAALSLYHP
eukprot:11909233-Prorocentrum_lima.AAC.1